MGSDSFVEQVGSGVYHWGMDRGVMLAASLMAAVTTASGLDVTSTPAPANAGQAAAPDTSSIILAPKPAAKAAAPKPSGDGLSPGLTAAISAGMPAYVPQSVRAAAASGPDLRDIDRPKNEIPRLPATMMSRYVVHSTSVHIFRNRDLYTKSGLIELAMKEHPGLRIGNIFGLNSEVAYEMFLDDERNGKMEDLQDTALAVAVGGDGGEAQAILDETDDAFMRTEDFSGPVHIK